MGTKRIPKQALQYKPKGRRNIGRPRKRWTDQFHFEDQGTGKTPNPSWTWRLWYHPYVSYSKQKERCLKNIYFVIHIEYSAIHCLFLRDSETFIDTWLFIVVPKCNLEESCLCTTPLSFKAETEFIQLHCIFVTSPAVPMCLIHQHADRSVCIFCDTILPWNARNFHITKRSSKTSLMLLTLLP